jgi:hypothetical protein
MVRYLEYLCPLWTFWTIEIDYGLPTGTLVNFVFKVSAKQH